MTDVMKAIILGIIEGLTEFLPVSSTGHLILAGHLLSFEGQTAITFKIVIQLGAVMAVLLLYWKRYLAIGANLIRMDFSPSKGLNVIHMMLAMLPALILYLLFKDTIKSQLFGPIPVLIGLVAGGLLMIIAARSRRTETAETMDRIHYKQAFGIGLFQCLALWRDFRDRVRRFQAAFCLAPVKKPPPILRSLFPCLLCLVQACWTCTIVENCWTLTIYS